jgi:hypothetical protein
LQGDPREIYVVAIASTQLVRGTFLRTADLRSRPANIRVAANRSTSLRLSAPPYAGLRRFSFGSFSEIPLTGRSTSDLVEDDAVVSFFNDLQGIVRTPRPRTLLTPGGLFRPLRHLVRPCDGSSSSS